MAKVGTRIAMKVMMSACRSWKFYLHIAKVIEINQRRGNKLTAVDFDLQTLFQACNRVLDCEVAQNTLAFCPPPQKKFIQRCLSSRFYFSSTSLEKDNDEPLEQQNCERC